MTKVRISGLALAMIVPALLVGCATPGAESAANVYDASQVNQRQEAKVVSILAVLPARVQVSNEQNKKTAQIVGGLAGVLAGGVLGNNLARTGSHGALLGGAVGGVTGVAAGSLVADKVLVDGVSLTFEQDGHTFNSAQVGRQCEFQPGKAVMVSGTDNETRIQSNATCPIPPPKA